MCGSPPAAAAGRTKEFFSAGSESGNCELAQFGRLEAQVRAYGTLFAHAHGQVCTKVSIIDIVYVPIVRIFPS